MCPRSETTARFKTVEVFQGLVVKVNKAEARLLRQCGSRTRNPSRRL